MKDISDRSASKNNCRKRGYAISKAEIQRDIEEIGRMLSVGMHLDTIKQRLGFSNKQIKHRLRHARRAAIDTHWVWTRHYLAMMALVQELAGDRDAAREKGQYRTAAYITDLMAKRLQSIVEVGQSLGVIERAPEKVDVSLDPTLGMFHDLPADYSEVEVARLEAADSLKTSGNTRNG